jgi:hypothetical protein
LKEVDKIRFECLFVVTIVIWIIVALTLVMCAGLQTFRQAKQNHEDVIMHLETIEEQLDRNHAQMIKMKAEILNSGEHK